MSGSRAEGWRLSSGAVFAAVLLGATIVRLAAAALIPLTEDEAYYRLWSMRPAFGYFDHPPMIAWWVWLGRQIAGDTPLGVRLVPVLGTALTTWLTYDVARQAELGERTALRAA
ncbi:MAG TPA: glycosyltransferase family 39 protein, partial [Caulobacteraceae bacterium]|nr:glycosyltransferase family 39 protein [Caulobacteraceae bacterium]